MGECCGAPPGAPVDGMDDAISAWRADVCGETSAEEFSREDERKFAPLVRAAQERELAAWSGLDVFRPVAPSNIGEARVGARWVLTWKGVDGETTAKGRVVIKGFQGPKLQQGLAGPAWCVGLRSSHSQLLYLHAVGTWGIWSLGIECAFLQADSPHRDACVHAAPDWVP